MKKLTLAVAALLSLSIFSCGGNSESNASETTNDSITPTTETVEAATAITDSATETVNAIADVVEAVETIDQAITEDSEPTANTGSSEDWDAALDSYEEYVDQYIALMKKAKEGDMTALSEYPALLEKANDFNKKLSSADSDLSTSQMARYTKITAKLTKAAL